MVGIGLEDLVGKPLNRTSGANLFRMPAEMTMERLQERRRLTGRVPEAKVEVVPHFVEARPALPDRAAARESLGVARPAKFATWSSIRPCFAISPGSLLKRAL